VARLRVYPFEYPIPMATPWVVDGEDGPQELARGAVGPRKQICNITNNVNI